MKGNSLKQFEFKVWYLILTPKPSESQIKSLREEESQQRLLRNAECDPVSKTFPLWLKNLSSPTYIWAPMVKR